MLLTINLTRGDLRSPISSSKGLGKLRRFFDYVPFVKFIVNCNHNHAITSTYSNKFTVDTEHVFMNRVIMVWKISNVKYKGKRVISTHHVLGFTTNRSLPVEFLFLIFRKQKN